METLKRSTQHLLPWDPYHVGDISELEKVQRRAARWVLNDYGRFSSVSLMLDQLKWPTLQIRRQLSRLQIGGVYSTERNGTE